MVQGQEVHVDVRGVITAELRLSADVTNNSWLPWVATSQHVTPNGIGPTALGIARVTLKMAQAMTPKPEESSGRASGAQPISVTKNAL